MHKDLHFNISTLLSKSKFKGFVQFIKNLNEHIKFSFEKRVSIFTI